MRRQTLHRFESLEPRLALAGVVSFVDFDGDIVTVRTDRGTTPQLNAAMLLSPSGGLGGFQLQSVNLFDPAFNRTNLSITARPSATSGDGIVNVGEIVSTFDLGTVSVGGDLGRIVAGDGTLATPGIRSFKCPSIGMLGSSTGATNMLSTIYGPATSIRVAGGVVAARFAVTGRAADVVIGGSISGWNANDGFEAGSIGRLVIGGSVYGGSVADSGRVFATRGIDRLVIHGDLVGGTGTASGAVLSGGQIGFARVGGWIAGRDGANSGVIFAAGITRLEVGASIGGGVINPYSGRVFTTGAIGSAVVSGSIFGGADFCGGISAGAGIGSITIGGDLLGGGGYGSGSVSAGGRIGSLQVNRIQSGSGLLSGSVGARSLGRIAVRTDILGSSTQPVSITGLGAATPTGPRALDSLTVGGSMVATLVLGGYNGLTPVNGAARIGTVTVRGNMIASSVVAGVENMNIAGLPFQFGDGSDVSIAGRRGSRIDSLVVNGLAQGSGNPIESSGVLANSIGTVRVGGQRYAATRAGNAPTSPNLQFRLI